MNRTPRPLGFVLLLAFFGLLSSQVTAQSQRTFEHVLIETPKPYDRVAATVRAAGGKVTREFSSVDALAADIPVDRLATVRNAIAPNRMSKDVAIPRPGAIDVYGSRQIQGKTIRGALVGASTAVQSIPASTLPSYAAANPEAYAWNMAGTRIDRLHALGFTGRGVTVAVIDSGIRPGFPSLELDDSVIGGEDFVGDGLNFSDWRNSSHGTLIAGIISGNALFRVNGALKDAILANAPDALDSNGRLPIIGSAPSAKIYAIRVFGDDSTGAPVSVLVAAIERVIELRRKYDRGAPGGVNIQVCNLSFGGVTLHAGRTVLDQAVNALLVNDIVPIVSAGNSGPSSLTISNPGTAAGALTVGATSPAANERIGVDLGLDLDLPGGPGLGVYLRPSSATQTAWFSSRGPSADGSRQPDVVASGVFDVTQGQCENPDAARCPRDISLATGTSFAVPIVSGVAASLRQAFPWASAAQIRNAIEFSGRSGQIGDGSTVLDRGRGLVDAWGAFALLAGGVSGAIPHAGHPTTDVQFNIESNTTLDVRSGVVRKTVGPLRPGQRADILYNIPPGTARVLVNVTAVTALEPPDQQNLVFGDGAFVAIHSAKTSAIGATGDYLAGSYPRDADAYVIEDPDTGILRVTISGDTINAGRITARVSIISVSEPLPRITSSGIIRDHESLDVPIWIPHGTRLAEFLLSWMRDWGHYPTSDIDLILYPPAGAGPIVDGISLAGPERVTMDRPRPGRWIGVIDGFDIPAGWDRFRLRALIDRALAP